MAVILLRKHTQAALVLVTSALSLTSCTGPGGGEQAKFVPIPVDEARLVLHAPGLEPTPWRYSRQIDDFRALERGSWLPSSGGWPEASLILFTFTDAAPSGMSWVREPALEQRIRGWFPNEADIVGLPGTSASRLGDAETQRFTRSQVVPCVFVRVYGDTYSDQRSYLSDGSMPHGNFMIRGWYCAPPNTRLENHVIDSFVAGIGVKGLWEPGQTARQPVAFAPASVAATATDDHDAKVQRVVFTTRISSNNEPVDDLREISMEAHDSVYIFVEWKISLKDHAEFFNEWRVLDGSGKQKFASAKLFKPRSESWRTWLPVQFAKQYDKPGQWRFEVYFDNEKMVEEYLTVLP